MGMRRVREQPIYGRLPFLFISSLISTLCDRKTHLLPPPRRRKANADAESVRTTYLWEITFSIYILADIYAMVYPVLLLGGGRRWVFNVFERSLYCLLPLTKIVNPV